MSKSITKIASESNDDYYDDAIATLCEALLHFMLTICTYHHKEKFKSKMIWLCGLKISQLEFLQPFTSSKYYFFTSAMHNAAGAVIFSRQISLMKNISKSSLFQAKLVSLAL